MKLKEIKFISFFLDFVLSRKIIKLAFDITVDRFDDLKRFNKIKIFPKQN